MFFVKKNKIIKSAALIVLGIFCACLNFAQASAPSAPSDVSLSTSCLEESQYITITWEHVFNQSVEKYRIYRDNNPFLTLDDDYIKDLSEGSFVSWIDYSAVSGNSYIYYIKAINNNSESSGNSESKIKTAPYCPLPTLSLSTECYGLSPQIHLDWTFPDNVDYIDLYRGNNFCVTNTGTSCISDDDCPEGDNCFSWINQFPSHYLYWYNKNLDNVGNYTYYIKVSGSGWSTESEKASIQTLNCAESIDPSPLPELTITPTCIGEVGFQIETMVLNWTRSEHIHKYIIHKDSVEGNFIQDNIPQSDSPFYNDAGEIGTLGEIALNTTYTYKIEAFNDNLSSTPAYSSSTIAIFTEECSGQDAPGSPINLLSESRCNGVDPIMRISWDAPTEGGTVSNYFIYRNTNGGVFSYYTSVSNTFYDDENVNTGEAAGYYKYKIEALGIGGGSPEPFPQVSSQEVSNCGSAVAPVIDSINAYCSVEENPFVRIEWSQPGGVDSSTDYFNIYRELGGSGLNIVNSTANNSIYLYDDYTVASNIPDNEYFYNIEAVGFGAGDSMAVLESVSVGWCDPTVPTVSLSKTCDGSGSSLIDISWAASKNLNYYEVWRDGIKLDYSGTDTSYQDTVSGAINTYSYEVKAVGKNGTEIIDTNSITTDDCATLTSAPNINEVDSESRCELAYFPFFYLKWDQVSNAEYYQVYRQKDEAGEVEELIYTSPNGTIVAYDDDNFLPRVESGADYFYRVVATKAGVNSTSSNAILFNIDWCPPSSPSNLNDSQSCSGTQPIIDITWDESLNTASYEIYRKSDNSVIILSDVPIGTSLTESYSDNTATEGNSYYYTIRSVGEDGSNTADSAPYEIDVGYCSIPDQSQISLVSLCNGTSPYVGISWTAALGAMNYNIHKVQGASIIPGIGNLFLEDTVLLIYNDNFVTSGNTYSYVSLACSMGDCSSYNNPIDVRESIYVEYCDPEILVFTATPFCDGLGNSVVELNWPADTTGNLDYYKVARDISGTGFVVLDNNIINTADSYTNDQNNPTAPAYPPVDSTNYTYYLTTVGHNGSQATSTDDVLTYDCALPNEPTITMASAGCDTDYPFVHLDWADVLDFSTDAENKYYKIQQNGITIFNTQDIVGIWHFNGNANDESIYGNNGIINGATFTAGNFGNALTLDGNQDWVQIPHSSSLDITGNQITLMAWVKMAVDFTNNYGVIVKNSDDGTYDIVMTVESDETPSFRLNTSNGYNRMNPPANSIQVGQWHHLAGVYDGATMIIYIDGVNVASDPHSGNIVSNNDPVLIGRHALGDDRFFNGQIDEVVIYSRALSVNEIKGAYCSSEHSHPTVSEYYDYSVQSPNSYNYTVIAGNIGGENSDSAGPITVDWCDASAPKDFILSQNCDGAGNVNVILDWDQNVEENVNHYIIERHNVDVGTTDILESNLNSSLRNYTDDSPPANSTNYNYSLISVGNSGNYATSTQLILTNDCSLLGVNPNISTSTPSCNNSIPYGYLEWDSVSGASYYEIYRDFVKVVSTTNAFYSDYDIINTATGVYLGNSFDYYIKACNFGGCVQGTGGNIIFNDPNSACQPFKTVLMESEARCEPDGFGGIDGFADLKWYDLFPDSANNYEVLISGNSTSTTAENYNSSDEKEYIDFEKILDESFEGATYSFILRLSPKNPVFSSIDSNQINLGVPECDAPAKPILDEPIPGCDEDQPQISLNWGDDLDTNYYEVWSTEDIGGVPGIWQLIEPSSVQSEYIHYSDNAFFAIEVNKKYHYYVKAFGDSGSYNISDTVSTTTPVACYNSPLKPVISEFSVGKCDNNFPPKPYIEIQWDKLPEENNTDYYEIWRSDQAARLNNTDILDNKANFSSYDYIGVDSKRIDSTVVINTSYEYYLIAIGQGGSTQSDTKIIITHDCEAIPDVPGNFLVAADCYGYCEGGTNAGVACNDNTDCDSNNCVISFIDGASMVLNWDRTINTFQYVIYENYDNGGYIYHSTIDEVGYNNYDSNNSDIIYTTSSATYIIHLAEDYIGKDCSYSVKARGWGGDSAEVGSINNTVKICGNTPMFAKTFSDDSIRCNEITLSWMDKTEIGEIGDLPIGIPNKRTGGEFYFQVYRSDDCSNYIPVSTELPASTIDTSRTYTDSGLIELTEYCWQIKSWNPAGEEYNNEIQRKTIKCPPADFILKKHLASCSKIELFWSRPNNYMGHENAMGYKIYRTTDKNNLYSDQRNNALIIDACRYSSDPCEGDLDGDDDVDSLDRIIMADAFLGGELFRTDCLINPPPCISDLNKDGTVNFLDRDIFLDDFCRSADTDIKCIDDVIVKDRCVITSTCDIDDSDGSYHSTSTQIYHFTDYFNINDKTESFPPGEKYYYVIQALPIPPATENTDSNILIVQPCPALPEWREVGF